jgi:hypothetical protein
MRPTWTVWGYEEGNMKLGRILTALNTMIVISIRRSALGRNFDFNIGRVILVLHFLLILGGLF